MIHYYPYDVPQWTEFETEWKGDRAKDPDYVDHRHKLVIKPYRPKVNDLVLVLYIPVFNGDGEGVGLVIGGKGYGKYRWTIKDHKTKMEYTDANGDLYAVEVTAELLEYLKGESHNTSKDSAAPASAPAQPAPAATRGSGGAEGRPTPSRRGTTSGPLPRSSTGAARTTPKSMKRTGA